MKHYEAEVNGVTHTFQLDSEDAKRAEDAGVDLKQVRGPRSAADPDADSTQTGPNLTDAQFAELKAALTEAASKPSAEVEALRAEVAELKAAAPQGDTAGTAANKSGRASGTK